MTLQNFARATGVAVFLVLASGTSHARGNDEPAPESVCNVLGTADRYLNTTVTIRGIASSDGKFTLLSDGQCKGAVDLTLDDKVAGRRDISAFRRVVAKGTRTDATVFGRFRATGDAQRPYAIDVYSVRDVNEVQVAEGG